MRVEVVTTGVEETVFALQAFAGRAADLEPAFEVLNQSFEEAHERWFDSEGAHQWPPLSTSTLKRKRGGRKLVESGRLHASLTQHTSDSVRRAGPTGLIFGTTVSYAFYHRFGTKKMPMRRPLIPSIVASEIAVGELTAWLMGAGFRPVRGHTRAGVKVPSYWRRRR